MSVSSLSRRRLLQTLGIGAGSLFLPSLLPRGAQAAPGSIKRILIFISSHQLMPQGWAMRQGNPAREAFEYSLANTPDADFSRTLAPLAAYKDRMLCIEGPAMQCGYVKQRYANGHDVSAIDLLTAGGYDSEDSRRSYGPSVDQVIASAVAHPDRIPSLELGGNGFFGGYINAEANQRVAPVSSPRQVFERLFPNPDESPEPTERSLIQGASADVLSTVQAEFDASMNNPRLASADRTKLELHRDMLGDLQRRLAELASLECEVPQADFSNDSGVLERMDLMARLSAAAFACDLTRVITVQPRQLANDEFDAPPGDVHQDYAHSNVDNATAHGHMLEYNATHGRLFAQFVDQIAQYSDSSGNLLDQTLVVWMSEHGLRDDGGPHANEEMPITIVGNVDGYFNTGRYVSLPRSYLHPMASDITQGAPHNQFLVSLMQAMGLENDRIGMESYIDADGNSVDMTGPLPGLT